MTELLERARRSARFLPERSEELAAVAEIPWRSDFGATQPSESPGPAQTTGVEYPSPGPDAAPVPLGQLLLSGVLCLASLEPLLRTLLSRGSGVLHAEQTFEYLAIPKPDELVESKASLRRCRETRGGVVLQLETELTAESLVTTRGSSLLFVTAPGSPLVRADSQSVDRSEQTSNALTSVRHAASLEELVRYCAASGDFNPLHYDPGAAQTAGLPGPVVHGMLIYAWALSALRYTPPASAMGFPLRSRFRFREPLYVGVEAELKVWPDLTVTVDSLQGARLAQGNFEFPDDKAVDG